MNQDKTIMSRSYMRASRKKQLKAFMKRAEIRNQAYEIENQLILTQLREAPHAKDLNHYDI